MATYVDIFNAAQAAEYKSRVTVATTRAAVAISSEDQGALTVEQHLARQQYAKSVLERGGGQEMGLSILAQLDQADHWLVTDQQIYDTVAGLWNAYAGA